jgi:DNA repair protein RadC
MENGLNQPDWIRVAEVELVYKTNVKPSERPRITIPGDCYKIFLQYWDTGKIEYVEQFKILLLNKANRVLGIYEVSTGTVSQCIADPIQIFCAALKTNACFLVLCHNHPSGNLQPSAADKALTGAMVELGKLLDIRVLNHLIINSESYYSFGNEGML